jgi:hypothetical protein
MGRRPRCCGTACHPIAAPRCGTGCVELANLASPTLAEVIQQAHRGIERVRGTPHLAYSFLRHARLSVS